MGHGQFEEAFEGERDVFLVGEGGLEAGESEGVDGADGGMGGNAVVINFFLDIGYWGDPRGAFVLREEVFFVENGLHVWGIQFPECFSRDSIVVFEGAAENGMRREAAIAGDFVDGQVGEYFDEMGGAFDP